MSTPTCEIFGIQSRWRCHEFPCGNDTCTTLSCNSGQMIDSLSATERNTKADDCTSSSCSSSADDGHANNTIYTHIDTSVSLTAVTQNWVVSLKRETLGLIKAGFFRPDALRVTQQSQSTELESPATLSSSTLTLWPNNVQHSLMKKPSNSIMHSWGQLWSRQYNSCFPNWLQLFNQNLQTIEVKQQLQNLGHSIQTDVEVKYHVSGTSQYAAEGWQHYCCEVQPLILPCNILALYHIPVHINNTSYHKYNFTEHVWKHLNIDRFMSSASCQLNINLQHTYYSATECWS